MLAKKKIGYDESLARQVSLSRWHTSKKLSQKYLLAVAPEETPNLSKGSKSYQPWAASSVSYNTTYLVEFEVALAAEHDFLLRVS